SAVRCRKGVGGGQRAGADRGDARGDKGSRALYRESREWKPRDGDDGSDGGAMVRENRGVPNWG
ncbi:hypothetical protein PIB30_086282, partial [Stylosanthes scabra]|nr:hypothetical protein [Stylosanthes scabra]